MGTLKEDVEAFVNANLSNLSLELDLAETLNTDRTWPDGTTRTPVEYFADQAIGINWGIRSMGGILGGYNPNPDHAQGIWGIEIIGDLMYALDEVFYNIGESVEDVLESLLEIVVQIGVWLLDVVWTDIILNTLIKWVVWIIAAGLRVVVGAPSYMLGKKVLLDFLEQLDNSNVHRFFSEVLNSSPLTGANDENNRQDFSSTISSILSSPALEGLFSSSENSPMSEIISSIMESDIFNASDEHSS